jgi:magnesium transporter
MTRLIKKHSKAKGLKPGSVVFVGEQKIEKATIEVIDYTDTELQEKKVEKIEDCFEYKETQTITWININGIHEVENIEKLGEHFGIHALTQEDIANTGHRPKLEDNGEYIFVTLKMLYQKSEDGIESEQVSIVFGKNYVLSFQEKEGDVFEAVRERIRRTEPRVRFMGSDYLAYALIDAIVDNYFVILENIGDTVEDLEDELVSNPVREDLETIYDLKREMVFIRKAIWPLREVAGGMDRAESALIHDFTRPYLRDLYEHIIQVIDTVETFRDMISGLLDIYLSSISNRMNQVMKVLTIIATIFIPLGFLAGVYGMNFDTSASPFNMPELSLRYGYIFFWVAVLIIGIGLLFFFRRKKWL